jgi:hypothetical protein
MKRFIFAMLAVLLYATNSMAGGAAEVLNVRVDKVGKIVDEEHGVLPTAMVGSIVQPTKPNYGVLFHNQTSPVSASGVTSGINLLNFVHENDPDVHPYPSQIEIVSVSVISESLTSWRVYLYGRDTFEGTGYMDDGFMGSVNFGSLNLKDGVYAQDVQGTLPYVDLDKTNELHLRIQNLGSAASRCSLIFIYRY